LRDWGTSFGKGGAMAFSITRSAAMAQTYTTVCRLVREATAVSLPQQRKEVNPALVGAQHPLDTCIQEAIQRFKLQDEQFADMLNMQYDCCLVLTWARNDVKIPPGAAGSLQLQLYCCSTQYVKILHYGFVPFQLKSNLLRV